MCWNSLELPLNLAQKVFLVVVRLLVVFLMALQ